MPAFHFTLHAFRSWKEDNPRGCFQRGKPGIQKPNSKLAAHRDAVAKGDEVTFSREQMAVLLDAVLSTAERKNLYAHAAAATATHVHVVVHWTDDRSADDVQAALKSGLGFCLSKDKGTTGNRWFSRGGAPEQVNDHAHLFHLLSDYLPKHATEQGGLFRNFGEECKEPPMKV